MVASLEFIKFVSLIYIMIKKNTNFKITILFYSLLPTSPSTLFSTQSILPPPRLELTTSGLLD